MKNIVYSVILVNYAIFATLCSFRLLFRCRTVLALPSPERVFAFEQGALLFAGRAFPCRLDTPKPGLPRGAGSDLRVAYFGRGSGAGLVVSSQFTGLDPDILFKHRNSNAGVVILLTITFHGIVPIRQGLEVVLRKRASRSYPLRSARRVLKGATVQHERARYRSASLVGRACWLSSQCGSAWNEFRTRTRGRRIQGAENRPEYHHGRNQRLVRDRWKRRLRRDSHLLLSTAGHLSLRISARRSGSIASWPGQARCWQRFSLL